MPHVIVKLLAGRSAAQKTAIAEALAQALMASAGCEAAAVSVGIEDVAAADWVEAVYRPEILGKAGTIFKPPGYDPL